MQSPGAEAQRTGHRGAADGGRRLQQPRLNRLIVRALRLRQQQLRSRQRSRGPHTQVPRAPRRAAPLPRACSRRSSPTRPGGRRVGPGRPCLPSWGLRARAPLPGQRPAQQAAARRQPAPASTRARPRTLLAPGPAPCAAVAAPPTLARLACRGAGRRQGAPARAAALPRDGAAAQGASQDVGQAAARAAGAPRTARRAVGGARTGRRLQQS